MIDPTFFPSARYLMTKPNPSSAIRLPEGLAIRGDLGNRYGEILTPDALAFVAELERRFGQDRHALLQDRIDRQVRLDAGERPNFLGETRAIRRSRWKIRAIPKDLTKRQVEITGPVDRKMVINALNSGADTFMADFEDSTSPSWENIVGGQVNLKDAVHRTISHRDHRTGRNYQLCDDPAVLLVRPRGWHLEEKHIQLDGRPVSASLFDFGLYLFHNARTLLDQGSGPYFYLPKLQNHREAQLWNRVFVAAQQLLDLPIGTIKATVLIEHVLAAFEMDEILWELRDHVVGLNCGRWDYIFSFIKSFRAHPHFVLPDRASIGMDRHFLRSYSQLLIKTCHRRGAHAIGGMAAQIPIKNDEEANARALAKVTADKKREATDGHDGTWIAHPGLLDAARAEFENAFSGDNQVAARPRNDVSVAAADLLAVPSGEITESGLRDNLAVGLRYLENWIRRRGCVPINHLMEDAATCEISRAQIWQWTRHRATLSDGRLIDRALVRQLLAEEHLKIRGILGEDLYLMGRYEIAAPLWEHLLCSDELHDFLTIPAYRFL